MRNAVDVPGVGTLRYDWDAIERLIAELGADFDARISKAAQTLDVGVLALVVAIGAGVSVDDVKRASPPITPTFGAVIAALNLAFHGQQEAQPSDGDANPTRRRATSSSARGSKRTGRV